MQNVMPPTGVPATVVPFYQSHEGEVCAALLRDRLQWFWPDLRQQKVLGIGYTQPYLGAWRGRGALCVSAVLGRHGSALMTLQQEGGRLPPEERTCLVDARHLPFGDEAFDRILLVHALQDEEQAVTLLRAAGRVLRDDGRMVLIVPNWFGGRLRQRGTPFAHETAFTRGSLRRVLAHAMLHVERRDEALFLPAGQGCTSLQRGQASDIAGKVLSPGLGSLRLVEVVKDVYSARPLPVAERKVWFSKMMVPVQDA